MISVGLYIISLALGVVAIYFGFRAKQEEGKFRLNKIESSLGGGSFGVYAKSMIGFFWWGALTLVAAIGALTAWEHAKELAKAETQETTSNQKTTSVAASPSTQAFAGNGEKRDVPPDFKPPVEQSAVGDDNPNSSVTAGSDPVAKYQKQCIDERATNGIKLGGMALSEATKTATASCEEGKALFTACISKPDSRYESCFREAVPSAE